MTLKFLELANTDPDVKNLLCYGIEGRHYNLVDGKVLQVDDWNNMYWSQNWTTGNMMISYLLVSDPDDKWEQYDKFNNSAINSVSLGFYPSLEKIQDKLAALSAVRAEYTGILGCGATDPGDLLAEFINEYKNAGIDDVLAEIQSQFDEWKTTR